MRHALVLLVLIAVIPCSFLNAKAQWQIDGVPVCTTVNSQGAPTVVSDGAGGAIVTWVAYRSVSNWDIYAQRVNNLGVPQWTADGVAICTESGFQVYPMIVSDGAGGAIVRTRSVTRDRRLLSKPLLCLVL